MEANIDKILKQTEGIEQIKKDLKVLNDLADKNKDDHKTLLEIKDEFTSYRVNNDKPTGEVDRNTRDINLLKETVKKLENKNAQLRRTLNSGHMGTNVKEQVKQQILRSEQRYEVIIEGIQRIKPRTLC